MTLPQSESPLTQSPVEYDFHFNPTQYTGDDGLYLLHSAIAIGASHDSIERSPPPRCHPQTRKVVFEIILAWTKNAIRGPRIMWVHGEGGSGKSAISQTVAEYCAHSRQLGASFFFAHNRGDLSNGRLLFPTIAYKLASTIPGLRAPMSRAIQADTSILTQSLEVQVQKLIIEPFRMVRHPPTPTLIVIDGLDACEDAEMQHRILTLIGQLVVIHRLPLCFFITSRMQPAIQATFDSPVFRKVSARIPLDVFISHDDIRTFLCSEFAGIRQYHAPAMVGIPDPWPSADVIELLVHKSGGRFLYPSTVVKYVDDPRGRPAERLVEVVVAAASPPDALADPQSSLDELYHHILSGGGDPAALLRALGPLAMLYTPLPQHELELLLGASRGELTLALDGVRALVDLPQSPAHCARVAQTSTTEFLTDLPRALQFWVDAGAHHAVLARGCIRYLVEYLDGAEDVNLAMYQYVRRMWTKHLANASPVPPLLEELCEPRFVFSRMPYEVKAVIAWLQSIPNVPAELLCLWQGWQAEMQSSSAFYVT
ncbi:hypothetical protein GGX14DRAFT_699737 [Mycena pura]|uniref:Nephrocystin 3-like N-terminal domain-containing protein n=1 Tax=Mycena pura TaxID=153505 RepID=A0AAD6Y3P6_9AGAR|nr:hypothetical protein GGX14DRAFT_699737 [Mycena pura]